MNTHTKSKAWSWSWSFSRIKNYRSCPKRHLHVDILRDVKEEKSDALIWGDAVHAHFAARLGKGVPFPKGYEHFEPWAEKILTGGGKLFVENKLAITAEFKPCAWFAKDAWFRCIADVIKIVEPVALVVDFKTGKIIEDSQQLALTAAVVFAHYPEVQMIRSEFIWLKEDATTREDFSREDIPKIWSDIWPEIETLKQAHETQTYPARPGGLCRRYCPVSACPHNGV
jgi:hypothetical protein